MYCIGVAIRPLYVISRTNRIEIVANICKWKEETNCVISDLLFFGMRDNSIVYVPNVCLKFFIDIFLIETELMQHANQKTIFFFGVIFALVCSIVQPQLMEWHEIASHLLWNKKTKRNQREIRNCAKNSTIKSKK